MTLLFIVIGLPPGLCSLYHTPESLELLRGGGHGSLFYAMLFGVPCLIGFGIFAAFLTKLIQTWLGDSR